MRVKGLRLGLVGLVGLGWLMMTACVPDYLQKYNSGSGNPQAEVGPYRSANGKQYRSRKKARNTIYAVSNNTFRFSMPYDEVWPSALNVLLNNYNITTLDKDSGVITTEWDTFYLNDKVYRNKVSMHLKRSGWNVVDVMLYNNVEVLHSGDQTKGNAVWLPSAQGKREIGRLIQNMALALNQTPPSLPEEMMARSPATPQKGPQSR